MHSYKDRPAGEAFRVLDLKEVEMKKMMKQMESMGMGGQMYNREQLKDEMERMEEEVRAGIPHNEKRLEV